MRQAVFLMHLYCLWPLVLALVNFTMDSSYEIEEYDSDNDLSGLTQEPSQTQCDVHGGSGDGDGESADENYRLLLRNASDLAHMSGNRTADFDDFVIGIMESDEEGDREADSDTNDEQLLIADLEKPVAPSPKRTMASSLAVSTVSCLFFS